MTYRTRLSSKGQIVLPKALRNARRWSAGAEFVIEERGADLLLKPRAGAMADWESLIGVAGYRGPRLSLKQMDDAIIAEASKQGGRPK